MYSTISSCVYFWVYVYSYLNKLQAFILILFLLHETTNYFEKLVYLVLEWLSPAGHSTAAPSNCFLPGPASCPGVRTHPFVYLDITELGLQTGQLQPVACSPMGNQGARACLSWVLTFPISQTKNSPCSQSCMMFSACDLSLFTIFFLFTFILAVKDTLIVCKYRQTDYFHFEVTGSDHSRRSQMTFPRATVQACAYFNSD